MPDKTFQHIELKVPEPKFGSKLTSLVLELEKLRSLQLKGTTHPALFFELKQLFHFLESIGSARIEGNRTTIAQFIETQAQELLDANVRLRIIGRRDRFCSNLCALIQEIEERSGNNTGLNLTVALDYGGRQDITNALIRIAEEIESGILTSSDINDDLLKSRMFTKMLPPVDLLIRTGGEKRLSNFLLWELSYAELFFSEKLWPDFDNSDLFDALMSYKDRERRFGGDNYKCKQKLRVVASD